MIDRYIYAVTRELPEKSKKEIGNEIRALIDDMMDEIDDTLAEEEKINKALVKLGNPKELANRYRGREGYLIGPAYFDTYLFVMKIVVLSIFIGISVASVIGVIFSVESISDMIGSYIGTLFSAVLQGAAWVTGIFALLEYKEISPETGYEQKIWEPSQLPELPEKKALISRGESIFAIIISTIFLPLFFFSPEIIGIYYNVKNQWNFIQQLNMDNFSAFKIIIFIIFTLNILVELIKIIKGRWTIKISVVITVLNVISSMLFINIISNMNIWNSEIVQNLERYTLISFERIIFLTIAVIILITICESVSSLYKGIKYGGKS